MTARQVAAIVLRARATPSSDCWPRPNPRHIGIDEGTNFTTTERFTNGPLEPMERQVEGAARPEPQDASDNYATPDRHDDAESRISLDPNQGESQWPTRTTDTSHNVMTASGKSSNPEPHVHRK